METSNTATSSALHNIEVKSTSLRDPDAVDLIEHHRQEVIAKYPAEAGVPPTAETLNVFLILKVEGKPVACGGLRSLEDQHSGMAELKRMYVLPEYRGQANGIADLLVERLQSAAMKHGWITLRLETGVDMPQARRYYERHGFHEIPLFGHYIDDVNSSQSVCYEKSL